VLSITAHFFLYCDTNCSDALGNTQDTNFYQHGALFLNKHPFGFEIDTHADPSLKDNGITIVVEIRDIKSDKSLFEDSWTASVGFSEQASRVIYQVTPPEIANLTPGPYKFYIAVVTLDGTFADSTSVIFIRHAPGLSDNQECQASLRNPTHAQRQSQRETNTTSASGIGGIAVGFGYCDGDCTQDSAWITSNRLYTDKAPMEVIFGIAGPGIVGKDVRIDMKLNDAFTGALLYRLTKVITVTATSIEWIWSFSQTPREISALKAGPVALAAYAEVIQAVPSSLSLTCILECGTFLYADLVVLLSGSWKGTTGAPFADPFNIRVVFIFAAGIPSGAISGDIVGSITNIRLRSDGIFTGNVVLSGQSYVLNGRTDFASNGFHCNYSDSTGSFGSLNIIKV
jgi:hypothetical protein